MTRAGNESRAPLTFVAVVAFASATVVVFSGCGAHQGSDSSGGNSSVRAAGLGKPPHMSAPGRRPTAGGDRRDPRSVPGACVDRREFSSVKQGMSVAQVDRLLEGPGKRYAKFGSQEGRRWHVCFGEHFTGAWVNFADGVVSNTDVLWE